MTKKDDLNGFLDDRSDTDVIKSESKYETDNSQCFVEWKNSFNSAKLGPWHKLKSEAFEKDFFILFQVTIL